MGHTWLTVAGLITDQPCKLIGLVVTPSAAAAACSVYKGRGTSDPLAFSILVAAADSKQFDFGDGLKFDTGLFISPLTNITGVLVIWEPISP